MDIIKAKELFELNDEFSIDNLKSKFRELARTNHPDVGGSNERIIVI